MSVSLRAGSDTSLVGRHKTKELTDGKATKSLYMERFHLKETNDVKGKE
jgi:hypothetical protein